MYLYWTIMNSPSLCTCVYVVRKFTLPCSFIIQYYNIYKVCSVLLQCNYIVGVVVVLLLISRLVQHLCISI